MTPLLSIFSIDYKQSTIFTQSLPSYFVKPRFLRTFALLKNDCRL